MKEESHRKMRKLSIPKEHIASLSDERVALLAAFSYHLSEVNVFWRVYNCCTHSASGKGDADFSISIQKNAILRVWSSKIYEFLDGLPEKTDDKKLSEFIKTIRSKLNPPKEVSTFKNSLAARFRNEATFHFTVESIKKRLKYTSQATTTDFFFDEVETNSFFPFGEEAVFVTSFNGYAPSSSKEEQLAAFEAWLEWIQRSSRELNYIFDEFLVDFIFSDQFVPDWRWVNLELEEGMIAKFGEMSIPLFASLET